MALSRQRLTPPNRSTDNGGVKSNPFQNLFLLGILVGLLTVPSLLIAKKGVKKGIGLHVSFDYLYTDSIADSVSGATYTKKYKHPLVIALGLGMRLNKIYFGIRYEHWLASRKFTLNGTQQSDTLKFRTLGAEIGYMGGNARVFYLFTGGIHLPLKIEVESTAGTFNRDSTPLTFQARGMLGIRFNSLYAVFVEAGYRWTNLGSLSSGGTSYVSGDFDLTGYFGGIGLFFEF